MSRFVACAIALAGCISMASANEYLQKNGETGIYRCVGPHGTRHAKDPALRVGERCRELTKKELAKMRADAQRPPSETEKKAMRARAEKMDFWRRCSELGRVVRKANTTPKEQYWADLVLKTAQIPAKDVGFIRDRRLRVGMDECSVVAVLGRPDDLNRTNNAAGRFDQLVYRSKRIYVYTTNGTVTSWQE